MEFHLTNKINADVSFKVSFENMKNISPDVLKNFQESSFVQFQQSSYLASLLSSCP